MMLSLQSAVLILFSFLLISALLQVASTTLAQRKTGSGAVFAHSLQAVRKLFHIGGLILGAIWLLFLLRYLMKQSN